MRGDESEEAVERIRVLHAAGSGDPGWPIAANGLVRCWLVRIHYPIALHFAESDGNHVLERVAVEDLGDGIAHIDHQHPQTAMDFIRTGTFLVVRLTGAADRREPAVDEAH